MSKSTKVLSNNLTAFEFRQKLDDLFDARDNWETGSYQKSNDELYDIIDRCHVMHQELKLMTTGRRKLLGELDAALSRKGIAFNANTSLVTKIVRCVFGDCGKRAFTYARVLIEADSRKDPAQSMRAFISDNGGIEEIRKSGNASASPKPDRKKLVSNAGNRLLNVVPILSGIKLTKELQPSNNNTLGMTAVLFRDDENGTGSIVFSSTSATLINTLLAASELEAIANGQTATAVAAPAVAANGRASAVNAAVAA